MTGAAPDLTVAGGGPFGTTTGVRRAGAAAAVVGPVSPVPGARSAAVVGGRTPTLGSAGCCDAALVGAVLAAHVGCRPDAGGRCAAVVARTAESRTGTVERGPPVRRLAMVAGFGGFARRTTEGVTGRGAPGSVADFGTTGRRVRREVAAGSTVGQRGSIGPELRPVGVVAGRGGSASTLVGGTGVAN
ncbi:hypothetical protein [Actinoplanes sp. CA-252034]|uniref:hypothetical protein n=1 Tax=Actinoplanes sp. CA-252034 TaxID=3239906 RepID=UPI003D95C30A